MSEPAKFKMECEGCRERSFVITYDPAKIASIIHFDCVCGHRTSALPAIVTPNASTQHTMKLNMKRIYWALWALGVPIPMLVMVLIVRSCE